MPKVSYAPASGDTQARRRHDAQAAEPRGHAAEVGFRTGETREVRRFVADRALVAGFGADQVSSIVLACHELVSNSMRHGGGEGRLATWQTARFLVVEVRDGGCLDDPQRNTATDGGAASRPAAARPEASRHVFGRGRTDPDRAPRRRLPRRWRRPRPDQEGGLGLWVVHELADQTDIDVCGDGTVVRLHFRLPPGDDQLSATPRASTAP